MQVVQYEVLTFEGSDWLFESRFLRSEKEAALKVAQEIEKARRIKTKVVCSVYNTESGAAQEGIIYITSPARLQEVLRQPAARAPRRAGARKPGPKRKSKSSVRLVSSEGLIVRYIAVIALALAVGIGALSVTPDILRWLVEIGVPICSATSPSPTCRIRVDPDILLVSTLVGSLLLVVFLLRGYLTSLQKVPPRKKRAGGGASAVNAAAAAHVHAVRQSLDKLAETALAEQEGRQDPHAHEAADKAREQQKREDEKAMMVSSLAALPGATSAEALVAESLQPTVARFLGGAVETMMALGIPMDNYNKFALTLYAAGASEALCSARHQNSTVRLALGVLTQNILGMPVEQGARFQEKMTEYLSEPRYLGATQCGRDAMDDFLRGDEAGAHARLRDVFENWNRKGEKPVQIVTIMFTDMVGSTDLTQQQGDSAAQEIVRYHNSIVRTSLARFSGRETKHTGDGIMASFASSANAVEAAWDIQQHVGLHNMRNPKQTMALRVGLNAGEPIAEDDDFFGATVQLAARICAETGPGQILCSAVVRDLSAGKTGTVFMSIGERSLKGFKAPVELFEVSKATL